MVYHLEYLLLQLTKNLRVALEIKRFNYLAKQHSRFPGAGSAI